VLQTWRERAGAKLIFISEQPADTTLDFLVDGIIELRQSCYDNLRVRQIFLQKLRGTRINRPSYLYTIENSIFYSFTPYQRINFEIQKRDAADLFDGPTRDSIKTGYPDLDASLGSGFPRKGMVLLELDSHVNMTIALLFLQRIVSNHVLSGNPVVLQPASWMQSSSILRFFETSLPPTKKSLLKIIGTGKNPSADRLVGALVKMKHKYRNKVLINIMSNESLQNTHGTINVRGILTNKLSSILTHADLSIALLTRSQADIFDFVSEISTIHLRLIMINDTLFLQSLVPSSNLYSLILDRSSHLTLKPVV
jgi:hypothetical protein